MTDLSTIRVIPFCRKADEWPIWNEKFMAKAKRYGFKDKLSIPNADEEFDKELDMGKKMLNAIELKEVAYTELLLSIDVKTSNGKIAFNIVIGCKSKDHPDSNAAMAWDKDKNKYAPSEAEYVAMSEAVKENRFVYFILCDDGIEVEIPIVVKTDNVGAMFMTQNSSIGVRSRHVDTRYHFVRENAEL
jgi:hypothetical protein